MRREILRYKRGAYGSPYHFLDFSMGKGYAITNEEDFTIEDKHLEREEVILDSPDLLAIKGLGQFSRFKAASAFRQLIENWQVSDFHINLARGAKDAAGYDEHLSITEDNLQLEEVFWLTKEKGYTAIKRASDDQQLVDYMAEGNQMGYLWKEGFFSGVDPQ